MTQTFINSKPTITCKVCHGTGRVRIGYYQHSKFHRDTWVSLTGSTEQCRNCSGTGKIIL